MGKWVLKLLKNCHVLFERFLMVKSVIFLGHFCRSVKFCAKHFCIVTVMLILESFVFA